MEPVSVLLVGLGEAEATALASDDGFSVTTVRSIEPGRSVDVVVIGLDATAPLDTIRRVRSLEPAAAVVVVTDPSRAADGTVALHAGAEDHLVRDELLPALLPRAIRYAIATNRMRRELATVDEVTALPTVRGFAPIAEHHLRMADRARTPVVFVFVRVEDRDEGDAEGAETAVLSRLVEAMALHDARREPPRSLKLSVGTARYEPGSGVHLAELLEAAVRGLERSGG